MSFTIAFDDRRDTDRKGFTSFFDWQPDWMFRLKNKFFTAKDGQLYRHHDSNQPKNNFYGVQYTTRITTIFNDSPNMDKVFKTMFIEGSEAWDVTITTNLTSGVLMKEDFNQRESRFYAPFFGDTTANDLKGRSAQGIGNITSNSGTTIVFAQIPTGVSVGDTLYQVNGAVSEQIGVISSMTATNIVVTSVVTTPVNGRFAYAKKSQKYEGGEIRGYYLKVDMENDSTQLVELFAINTNDIPSYVL